MNSTHRDFMIDRFRRFALLAAGMACILQPHARGQEPNTFDVYEGYLTLASLVERLKTLSVGSPQAALTTIGKSLEGRDIHALTLCSDPAAAADRPAYLIVAGLSGGHAVGTEVALRLAENLLANRSEILKEVTVYVIPCANPDAFVRERLVPRLGNGRNARPVDADRDGLLLEDPAVDLDDDGLLLTMLLKGSARTPATHVLDPQEPRLLRTNDPLAGEVPQYAVLPEGRDRDGDAHFGEDRDMGVDLNRNFMHQWPEHETDAGAYPLSEPESLALAQFVLTHRNVVVAITYGLHDNLQKTPEAGVPSQNPQVPRELHKDDKELYESLGALYRETVGQSKVASVSSAGSFHAWLYAQRGIVSLATSIWSLPEAKKAAPTGKPEDAEGQKKESGDDGKEPAGAGQSASDKASSIKLSREASEEKAWIAYADLRGGGFTPYKPFSHPELGEVLLGGFHPGFKHNPPSAELETLTEKQLAFLDALMERRPSLDLQAPELQSLGSDLYSLNLSLRNGGRLPTSPAMGARSRPVLSAVVRLEIPKEAVVSGSMVENLWHLKAGEQKTLTWLLHLKDLDAVTIAILDDRFGDRSVQIPRSSPASFRVTPRGKDLR